ncbi:hypothetical protein NDU88_007168 [Pleurodeles waltl]|uniref:Uncharacterized protein n=1 Tax=Pleurodeles waltl TaxID=8319 RepID=A0AAV7N4K8_PLEWA|nr:hypothetical protein NDU88_007168 [Pleurodeles waltl]
MRAAHSAPAAAGYTTPGHGFQRGEGPQASPRYRPSSSAHRSPQVRVSGSVRRPAIRRKVPPLRDRAARNSALERIIPAGPSRAG